MRSRRLTIENLQDRVLMAADLCMDMGEAAIEVLGVGVGSVSDPIDGLSVVIDQSHFGDPNHPLSVVIDQSHFGDPDHPLSVVIDQSHFGGGARPPNADPATLDAAFDVSRDHDHNFTGPGAGPGFGIPDLHGFGIPDFGGFGIPDL